MQNKQVELNHTLTSLSTIPPVVRNWGGESGLTYRSTQTTRLDFLTLLETCTQIAIVRSGRPKSRARQSNIQLIIDIWGTQFNKSLDVGFM